MRPYTPTPLPYCPRPERDCHSLSSKGKCLILKDANFGRPCPFYRSWRTIGKEDLEYFPQVHYLYGKKMSRPRWNANDSKGAGLD